MCYDFLSQDVLSVKSTLNPEPSALTGSVMPPILPCLGRRRWRMVEGCIRKLAASFRAECLDGVLPRRHPLASARPNACRLDSYRLGWRGISKNPRWRSDTPVPSLPPGRMPLAGFASSHPHPLAYARPNAFRLGSLSLFGLRNPARRIAFRELSERSASERPPRRRNPKPSLAKIAFRIEYFFAN